MIEQLVLSWVSLSMASSRKSVEERGLDSSNSDKVVKKLKSSQTLDLAQAVFYRISIIVELRLSKRFRKIVFLKFKCHNHVSLLSRQ